MQKSKYATLTGYKAQFLVSRKPSYKQLERMPASTLQLLTHCETSLKTHIQRAEWQTHAVTTLFHCWFTSQNDHNGIHRPIQQPWTPCQVFHVDSRSSSTWATISFLLKLSTREAGGKQSTRTWTCIQLRYQHPKQRLHSRYNVSPSKEFYYFLKNFLILFT